MPESKPEKSSPLATLWKHRKITIPGTALLLACCWGQVNGQKDDYEQNIPRPPAASATFHSEAASRAEPAFQCRGITLAREGGRLSIVALTEGTVPARAELHYFVDYADQRDIRRTGPPGATSIQIPNGRPIHAEGYFRYPDHTELCEQQYNAS